MGNGSEYWIEVGRRLGVEVVAPVTIVLAGVDVRFTALFPQFGALAGTVVDADWSVIAPHVSALRAAGFAYSCVEADAVGAALPNDVLADWGWTSLLAKPNWLA